MAASSPKPVLRRSARNAHRADAIAGLKSSKGLKRGLGRSASPPTKSASPAKRIKAEGSPPPSTDWQHDGDSKSIVKLEADKAAILRTRKLKIFSEFSRRSPFPNFTRPTPQDCSLAHRILANLHGDRVRPDKVVAPSATAGCGASPSVLDALVRTILSQNTSDKNSSRAKQSMDKAYGSSDKWESIVDGGQTKLQQVIQSGGLSVVKSKVIISILQQAKAKYGTYSLDHLFSTPDDEAMQELLSFQGVGPKTASCVLLFCLQRPSFAVDTHVYRITGLLGWRPEGATREEAQAHLDALVPDGEKYPLHVLIISHGKQCGECKAGGRNVGKCELRKAFVKGGLKGGVKIEQETEVKQER